MRALAIALIALVLPTVAVAQRNCVKGKPCGNSCIARNKTCRVGQGTARAAGSGAAAQRRAALPAGSTASAISANPKACAVARHIDGDTTECVGGRTLRLLLIDAPELNQGPFGAVAKHQIEQLAPPGTALRVETDVALRDRYGRELVYVYLPSGEMLNEAMLRLGVAIVSVYPPNVRHVDRFRAVEDSAREGRRGLWAMSAFECTPADFRAGRCK